MDYCKVDRTCKKSTPQIIYNALSNLLSATLLNVKSCKTIIRTKKLRQKMCWFQDIGFLLCNRYWIKVEWATTIEWLTLTFKMAAMWKQKDRWIQKTKIGRVRTFAIKQHVILDVRLHLPHSWIYFWIYFYWIISSTLMYISNDMFYILQNDFQIYSPIELESIFIKTIIPNKPSSIQGTIYNHVSMQSYKFNNKFLEPLLSKIKVEGKSYIFGKCQF